MDAYERQYEEILQKKQCICLKQLAINGSDLIAAGMKPGKEIGTVLNGLLELVLDDPAQNTKENLLEQAHKIMTPDI